jgi:hypothetical protein
MSGTPLHARVEKEIGRLADLSREELVDLWVKAHGCKPPKGVKQMLLERSAAYRIQAKAYGGLKPATRRYLLAVANGGSANQSETPVARNSSAPQPGARLVRQDEAKALDAARKFRNLLIRVFPRPAPQWFEFSYGFRRSGELMAKWAAVGSREDLTHLTYSQT